MAWHWPNFKTKNMRTTWSILVRWIPLGVASVAWALASNPLSADEGRGYGGIAVGSASYSDDELLGLCDDFRLDCTTSTSDTALKFFGGYRISPYFSVEAGYADWGEVRVEPISGAGLSFDASGPYLAIMPGIPIGDGFTVFAELGVGFLDANLRGTVPVLGEVARVSDEITAPVYGFGADFHLQQVSFRLLWERIDPGETYQVEGVDVSTPVLDLYTVAIMVRF